MYIKIVVSYVSIVGSAKCVKGDLLPEKQAQRQNMYISGGYGIYEHPINPITS